MIFNHKELTDKQIKEFLHTLKHLYDKKNPCVELNHPLVYFYVETKMLTTFSWLAELYPGCDTITWNTVTDKLIID